MMVQIEDKITTLRVLIADPFLQLREILRDILLRGLGVAEVLEAHDGEEAMGILRDIPPDVVIADSIMTPVNGIELTKKIRAGEDGVNPFTPVIIMSGLAEVGEILGARDVGANEYLAKPLSAKILALRLHAVIDKPRPFIRSDQFFGPDRRRHTDDRYRGQERRTHEPDVVDKA